MKGALILTAASMVTRFLSVIFRVYISNRIGSQGMGLYELVTSLYMLGSTLTCSGIGIAVTKMVSEEEAKGERGNRRRIMRQAITATSILGLCVCAVFFYQAEFFGVTVLQDARTVFAIRLLAPCFPFIAVSACIRSYFFALSQIEKPATAQLLEQVLRMSAIYYIAGFWTSKGIEYACGAAILGITIGEVCSCLYYSFLYRRRDKKGEGRPARKTTGRQLIKEAAPVAVGAYLNSILMTSEDVLIPAGLKKYGGSAETAMATYGMLKGMVLPVLLFPSTILSSFASLLLPEISKMNAVGNQERLNYTVGRVIHYTMILGIFIVAFFWTFPREIGAALYREEAVGNMLRLLSCVAPLIYVEMVVVSILEGLGHQRSSMWYNFMDSIFRIGVIYFFIPRKGVTAFLAVILISHTFTAILHIRKLLKVVFMPFELSKWVIKPAIAAAAAALTTYILYVQYLIVWFTPVFALLLAVGLLGAGYLSSLFLLGCLQWEDISWIKKAFLKKRTVRCH